MTEKLIPIALILAAGSVFFGYVNPAYSGSVKELRSEIKSYDGALAAAKDFQEKEAALIAEQSAIPEEGRARIEAFLPDGVDNVQLILDLNSLATRSGVRLSNFDVDLPEEVVYAEGAIPLESEGPVESLDITVTAVGSYSAFRTFLSGIEWSLRPMDLVGLSIEDSDTGVYTFNMVLRIYWLR